MFNLQHLFLLRPKTLTFQSKFHETFMKLQHYFWSLIGKLAPLNLECDVFMDSPIGQLHKLRDLLIAGLLPKRMLP